MAERTIYVTSEMLGYVGNQPTNPPGINPGQDGFGLHAPGVVDLTTRLTTPGEPPTQPGLSGVTYYRLIGTQLDANAETFSNGQWWNLQAYIGDEEDPRDDTNPANWVAVTGFNQMTPKQDLVNNLGMGNDYIVLEQGSRHIILDLDAPFSSTPTDDDFTYLADRDPNNTGSPTFSEADEAFERELAEMPCFTRGTMILTDRGEVAIEDLRVGDLVMTRDHGAQPIRWIGSKKLGALRLSLKTNLRPIRIKAGALGENLPAQDLTVSPQHRILVRSRIAQKMFGTDEVLVAAKQLLQVEGVDLVADADSVEYFHMLFDRHEVVFSNGAETESLYTGPEALKSLPKAAVEEIFALFPELQDETHTPVPARLLASGRTGRKLAVRHVQNNRALVAH